MPAQARQERWIKEKNSLPSVVGSRTLSNTALLSHQNNPSGQSAMDTQGDAEVEKEVTRE